MCHEGRERDLVLPVSLADVGEFRDGLVTAMTQVESLIRQLRSCQPWGVATSNSKTRLKKKLFFSLICSWATTQDVFHRALPMKQFSELYLVQLRFAEWELKLFMRTELLVNELAFCSYTSEYWMFTSRDVAFMIQETFWALGICFSWSKSYVLSPTNVSFPILHWKKKSLCLQYGNRWLIVCSQVNLFVSPPKASLSVTMIKSFSGWTRQRQVMGISPGRWFPGFRAEREMEHSWRMMSLSLWKVTCPFQLHESHPGFLVAL